MTDEQLKAITDGIFIPGEVTWDDYGNEFRKLAAFIEAAVLAEQAKQEPVAWKDTCVTIHPDDSEEREPCLIGYEGWESMPDGTELYAAPVVPAGMVMVPMEPTKAMIAAGYSEVTMEIENSSRDIVEVYKAMIAAAAEKEQK